MEEINREKLEELEYYIHDFLITNSWIYLRNYFLHYVHSRIEEDIIESPNRYIWEKE